MKFLQAYCLLFITITALSCSGKCRKAEQVNYPVTTDSEWIDITQAQYPKGKYILSDTLISFLTKNIKPITEGIYNAKVSTGAVLSGKILDDFLNIDCLNGYESELNGDYDVFGSHTFRSRDECIEREKDTRIRRSILGTLDVSDSFDTYVYLYEYNRRPGWVFKCVSLITVSGNRCMGYHKLSTNSDGFTSLTAVRIAKNEFGQIRNSLDVLYYNEDTGEIEEPEPEMTLIFSIDEEGRIHSFHKSFKDPLL